MLTKDLLPSFLAGLKKLGIPQNQVAQVLGCSESLISKVSTGERTLPLTDFAGLLKRLVQLYPQLRTELVQAALGELLAELGCELVVKRMPPPTPAMGNVVDLAAWRAHRMAA